MIEVIEEKEGWDEFVSTFNDSDFYHSFDYHMIEKGEGKPLLLKYSNGDVCIGLPLLIRKIPDSPFYDATSVYGYPGPLYKNISLSFDNKHFAHELFDYFVEKNIVAVFSRLNPFLPLQHKVLELIGTIEKTGPVVTIDLKKNIELQRKEFGRRLKGQLNKARRHCTVKKVSSDEDFQEFVKIYHENMDRVNAKPMYYFNDSYFKTLVESNDFSTETLLAVHNETNEVIGASLFVYKNSVVHYHLSGTRNEFLPLMPTKLLIDEMRIKATQLGLSWFNLGGGLAGANDTLLQFKSSFSKEMVDFCVWKLVVRPEIYKQLIAKNNNGTKGDYFPLYRCNGV
ncbi:lipid II:glycine glycyltransferase FemX [Flagellimonas flava]|uniref:FemAB family protein n=1 Tax=Flagellimonas flava TaxID=570519 RepID=A0A1M5J7K6_9FLAO|nr:peptidoglycan bridge formation glycyltransferase FemA/FemB family protein [Allomuricauda flava]SHG36554.1 FemAB family protein [Allomuricauda flava]